MFIIKLSENECDIPALESATSFPWFVCSRSTENGSTLFFVICLFCFSALACGELMYQSTHAQT